MSSIVFMSTYSYVILLPTSTLLLLGCKLCQLFWHLLCFYSTVAPTDFLIDLFQPSTIEKDRATSKLILKFSSRDFADGPQKNEEISDADCIIFAVGRSPCTAGLGLEDLVTHQFYFA